jgi:N-methylhydantoinase B
MAAPVPGLRPMACRRPPTPGVRGTRVEITEQISPLLYRRRELRADSGGAGRNGGGHGQIIEIEARDGTPFGLWAAFDRIDHPPHGRAGGGPGAAGHLTLDDGSSLAGKGYQEIPAGRRLIVHTPGGGGFGKAEERDPAALAADRRDGLATPAEPATG